MKIDNNLIGGLTTDQTAAGAKTAYNPVGNRDVDPVAGAGSDQVSLSSLGQKLQELSSASDQAREKRIEELSAAIDKGTYKADAGQVTSKLIDEAIELSKLPSEGQ